MSVRLVRSPALARGIPAGRYAPRSSRSLRSLTLASLLALLPGSAFAGAEIRAKIVDLRVQPSDNAKARLKLGAGREVAVLGKSDDGRWVKVSGSLERGEDTIKFEGWVMAAALDGDVPSASAAASSSDSGEAEWGDEGSDTGSPASEPAGEGSDSWDFSEESTSEAASAPAGDNSWDTGSSDSASSSDSSSSSGDEWDSGSADDSGDDWDS